MQIYQLAPAFAGFCRVSLDIGANGKFGFITYTSFGFESGRKRHFVVTVPGRPRIERGMTVIALLEKPDGFGNNGLLGWIDCHDGSLVCDSALTYFNCFLLCFFSAILFPVRAYAVFRPAHADMVACLVAALFGGFALHFLYISAKAFLVKRALMVVRDFSKLLDDPGLVHH